MLLNNITNAQKKKKKKKKSGDNYKPKGEPIIG
jgi:hypothetical protein